MSESYREELVLEGLSCASCAAKIEEKVQKLDGVSLAALNFTTKTLTIAASEPHDLDKIVAEAERIVKAVEPHVIVRTAKSATEAGEPAEGRGRLLRVGVGVVLFAMGLLLPLTLWAEFAVFAICWLIVGGDVVARAGLNIAKGQIFDENLLMTIATIGAFAIREFPEAAAVMLFYQVGEYFQDLAVSRSRKSIAALMDIRPDVAHLVLGDEIRSVNPEEVSIGARIIIRPGEKIPLDGIVLEGISMLDTSALTGEALPRDVEPGCQVLSGSINKNGLLTVEVTKLFRESTVSKILELVQNAGTKKAPTENFIHKFARFYTPTVVIAAIALAFLPPLLLPGASLSEWLNRALVFLVVSCPCALVISIPLSFFGGIGAASRKGILVKGGSFLEALNHVDTVVFDKTGTLTKGVFKVTKICAENSFAPEELLELAAGAESYSTHPIAVSIVKAYGKDIDRSLVMDFSETAGHGTLAVVGNRRVLVGNIKLMEQEKVKAAESDDIGTLAHVAVDGRYAGYILISDEIKADSREAVNALKSLGVKRLVMLTGDSKPAAEEVGRALGLSEIRAELLPDQKVLELERLENCLPAGRKLIFVGDGINDAPVLIRADIGVAMGGVGSDAAIEAADVVLMTDEPAKLVSAVRIAKRTNRIVWQNIIFAFAVKISFLVLGAVGFATIWGAVFADVGVALLAVLNALRVLQTDRAA